MEINGDDCIIQDASLPNATFDGESSVLRSSLFLDHVGEVSMVLNSDGLSWKLIESSDNDGSACLGIKLLSKVTTEIKFSDVYAVELTNYGLIHKPNLQNAGKRCLGLDSHDFEMYRFTVHGVQRAKTQPSLWVLAVYTFGHKDLQTCRIWLNRVNASLKMEVGRPKNLLVLVHPMSGKENGCRTWETVAPIFLRAKVKSKVIVTQRAGHAFDMLKSMTNKELNAYDGVVAVGGDGFFNEILNGFLSSRHKSPLPPAPSDFLHSVGNNDNPNVTVADTGQKENHPLLPSPTHTVSEFSNFTTYRDKDEDPDCFIPNEEFRFGIIPAGSTDAIALSTTGVRDPITSALHIVLGKRVCLDIAQIVRWRMTSTSKVEPCVRYAASFTGYGFYGDVITESEKYRWMGPKRYDYAGTKVFLKHRSYEAEIAYLEVGPVEKNPTPDRGRQVGGVRALWGKNKSERVICRVNCNVCNTKSVNESMGFPRATPYSRPKETRWRRSRGHFLSVGAAIMSNRNERAPDGLVADAHLSDGFLHLILIKDCPRAMYLWHLTQLAKKGGNPLNFEFVEYHKTPAFTFTSFGNESVWNLDGELFQAHQLSAQVFRGLVCLFASGPEV
ncbi:DAGK_cat domain-containing protein [Cephalotus follicularis]|uniref:DAGK_cat domain-containing protein n=1 Tax=Cephalotus follicularis TaxID=3775 RepID=A0A1Q3C680_CEPFO|nr:DAGK_cat domain-containing protein [Cephalotus follicularis]